MDLVVSERKNLFDESVRPFYFNKDSRVSGIRPTSKSSEDNSNLFKCFGKNSKIRPNLVPKIVKFDFKKKKKSSNLFEYSGKLTENHKIPRKFRKLVEILGYSGNFEDSEKLLKFRRSEVIPENGSIRTNCPFPVKLPTILRTTF